MCGIVAILSAESNEQLVGDVISMRDTLRHRGPDGCGVWVNAEHGVALGHRRLAVIELSDRGAQPMTSRSGRFVMIFNGEFYNYAEVRARLRAGGAEFRGESDTEVALAAIEAWGVRRALSALAGMFAVVIWDRSRSEMTLARDRIGEKPIYYGVTGGRFVVGSELKSLVAYPHFDGVVDLDVVSLYLRGNYVPSPYSIYRGIRKLPPGTALTIRREDVASGVVPKPEEYWSQRGVALEGHRHQLSGAPRRAIEQLDTLLSNVVREQLVADVPVGALLSGGVDSSTIVALMAKSLSTKVRTFTIGFDDAAYNEAPFAAAVAKHLGTDHTQFHVRAADALDVIPYLADVYDEPFGDSSQVPTILVSRLARSRVTVCLSGDGGDEVFGGYNRHVRLQQFWRATARVPRLLRRTASKALDAVPSSVIERILRFKGGPVLADQVQKLAGLLNEESLDVMYQRLTSYRPDHVAAVRGARSIHSLLAARDEWPAELGPMERLLWVESSTSLPDDMLVKVDRAAMASSLETRTPFVDHRIVEFGWKIPMSMKIRHNQGKWILREVLARYVPRALFDRPKSGFAMPIDAWLTGPLRDWAEELLAERRLREDGIFDPVVTRRLWDEHISGRKKRQQEIWGILMFQAWFSRWRPVVGSVS